MTAYTHGVKPTCLPEALNPNGPNVQKLGPHPYRQLVSLGHAEAPNLYLLKPYVIIIIPKP